MSFPRAQVKRFNEQPGCAPPPGHYNMPDLQKHGSGILPFETGGQRFKSENADMKRDDLSEQLSTNMHITEQLSFSSKKKLNFAAPPPVPTKSNSNKSTPCPSPSIKEKDKKHYEKEIRKLIQQINEQDRKLQQKIQESVKLEGRVSLLSKDKSSLLAHVATVERKISDLERKNCMLQSQKAVDSEKCNRRENIEAELTKTRQKLEIAKQELDKCRSLLVALQSDLESSRSTISALKQSNNVLTQLNKEVQEHSDDVSSQVTKLQGLADILRSEKLSAEENLSVVNEKFQNLDRNIEQLLQQKANEIERQCSAKQQAIITNLLEVENKLRDSDERETELRTLICSLNNEKDCLIVKEKCLKEEISSLQKEQKQCQSTIRNLEDAITLIKDENSGFKKQIEESESELIRLKAEHGEEKKGLEERIENLSSENKRLTSQNEKLISSMEIITQERDDLNRRIEDILKEGKIRAEEFIEIEAKLKKAHEELSTVKTQLELINDEKLRDKNQSDALLDKLKNLESEKDSLISKNNHSELMISDFKEQVLLLEAKSDHLETHLMKSNETASKAKENEESASLKIMQLEQSLKDKESQYQAKLAEFTRRLLDTQKKLNHKQQELQEYSERIESNNVEIKQMKKLIEENSQKLEYMNRLRDENVLLTEKVKKLENQMSEGSSEEIESWKKLYNDLTEKVEPFKVQIDAYSAEKSALLSENTAAHAEMQALGKKYAELLGHQNQRQKIRHVVKIKEENMGLKQEVAKLRTQIAKLQKQALTNRPHKFNATEAFQHKKENTTPFGQTN